VTALLDHFLEGEVVITAESDSGNYTTSRDVTRAMLGLVDRYRAERLIP